MDISFFHVDAFADRLFAGNPAGVCPLAAWLPDETLQAIAAENNLPETAFFVPDPSRGPGHYHLRWFTATVEVELCGHATLASAHVLMTEIDPRLGRVCFRTHSGDLVVTREEDGCLTMDFPLLPARPIDVPDRLLDRFEEALGLRPRALLRAVNLLAIFDSDEEIRRLRYHPSLRDALMEADAWGLCVTAPARAGGDDDFVSRFFAPLKGVPEDAVTGSVHCSLAPYWAGRLGKARLTGYQASVRGGRVFCRIDVARPDRVYISGHCTPYLAGRISLP